MADNSAPNYVGYSSSRVPFQLNATISARISNVVKWAQVSPDQYLNNAPVTNSQTLWAQQRLAVKPAQGQR